MSREPLWTWGGDFFGFREDDQLWTYGGRHVGRFYEEEVYNRQGVYLGEIRKNNRLITSVNKRIYRKSPFLPRANRLAIVKHVNYVGNVMLVGYQDFPLPESIE